MAALYTVILYMQIRQLLVPLLILEAIKGFGTFWPISEQLDHSHFYAGVRYMEEYTHKRPSTPIPGRHMHLFTAVMSAAVIVIEKVL